MLACRLPPCFLRWYFHSPCTEARFGSKLSKQPKQPQGAPTCPANCTSLGLPAPLMAPPPVMRQPTCWQTQLPPPAVGAQTWLSGQRPPQVPPGPGAHGPWHIQPPPAVGAQVSPVGQR